jgi:GNAT superfamily N-acetyltransferase
MISIRKINKKDIGLLKKEWKIEKPFIKRLEEQKSGKISFLICFLNKKPIGHGKIIWFKTPVIEDMYVKKDFRMKGIGRNLLHRLERLARTKSFRQVRLEISKKNIRGLNFYKREKYFTKLDLKESFIMEKKL